MRLDGWIGELMGEIWLIMDGMDRRNASVDG